MSWAQSQQIRKAKRRRSEASYSRPTPSSDRKRKRTPSSDSKRKRAKSTSPRQVAAKKRPSSVLDTTLSRLSAIGAASPDYQNHDSNDYNSIDDFESDLDVTLTPGKSGGGEGVRKDSPLKKPTKRRVLKRSEIMESLFPEESPDIQDASVQMYLRMVALALSQLVKSISLITRLVE